MIPREIGKRPRARFDQVVYWGRNQVDRVIRRLTQHWAIAAHCQRQVVQCPPLLIITRILLELHVRTYGPVLDRFLALVKDAAILPHDRSCQPQG
jgi:hypothetical protein